MFVYCRYKYFVWGIVIDTIFITSLWERGKYFFLCGLPSSVSFSSQERLFEEKVQRWWTEERNIVGSGIFEGNNLNVWDLR